MRKSRNLVVLIIAISAVSLFNSCDTEEAIVQQEELKTSTIDYANLMSAFSLFSEDELTSGDDTNLKSVEIASCLTGSIHENDNGEFWPRNWTLDYGTENCVMFSENTKRGKINISLSDFWRNEGSLKVVTFEDYFFNDNKLEGTKTILNTGLNADGNITFTKKITDASLTYADSTSISWECEKQSELIEGGSTFIFADDVWSVTGAGSGINLDGANYDLVITSPLIYNNGCFYPVSGIVEISTENGDTITMDYGTGECDNIALVTINGTTEELEL